jgi:hypothetical protein
MAWHRSAAGPGSPSRDWTGCGYVTLALPFAGAAEDGRCGRLTTLRGQASNVANCCLNGWLLRVFFHFSTAARASFQGNAQIWPAPVFGT